MHPNSPRYCQPEIVKEIARQFFFKPRVLVFADNDLDYAKPLINDLMDNFSWLQVPLESSLFQSLTKTSEVSLFHKIIPIISIHENDTLPLLREKLQKASNYSWVVFDTGGIKSVSGETLYGGTGKTFNWNMLSDLFSGPNSTPIPYFLAGGLNLENIGLALKNCNAQGFDVSSGIEEKPGKKNKEKMKNFIEIIKNYK